MKIELEVQDIKTLVDALNNAIVAYLDVVRSISFGCEVSNKFNGLKELDENILDDRLYSLKDVYNQLLKIEEKYRTEYKCPFCGNTLYKSDMPSSFYVCYSCNETFYGSEVKENENEI